VVFAATVDKMKAGSFAKSPWYLEIPQGWLAWRDGDPPCVALGPDRETVAIALTDSLSEGDRALSRFRKGWKIEVRFCGRDAVPSTIAVAAFIRRLHEPYIRISLTGIEQCLEWDAAAQWIVELHSIVNKETAASSANAMVIEIDVHSANSLSNRPLSVFDSRAVNSVRFVDSARDSECSRLLMDAAATLADEGVAVRASLVLRSENRACWHQAASSWYGLTRGHGLSIELADSGVSAIDVSESESLEAADIVEFYLATYQDRRFDLWRVEPFCTILQMLCGGSQAIAMERVVIAKGEDGECRVERAEVLEGDRRQVRMSECTCGWAPACRVISASPVGISFSEPLLQVQRLSCAVAGKIMPMMLRDWGVAIRGQSDLNNRSVDQRYRIAARDGRATVWNEAVVRDHRNRFGLE